MHHESSCWWFGNRASTTWNGAQNPMNTEYWDISDWNHQQYLWVWLPLTMTTKITPSKINMEPANHAFRKENDLPNLHDDVPAVNLQGCTAWFFLWVLFLNLHLQRKMQSWQSTTRRPGRKNHWNCTHLGRGFPANLQCIAIWLVVSTPLKNISQIGHLPQIGVKRKDIWNHHLPIFYSKNPVKIDIPLLQV